MPDQDEIDNLCALLAQYRRRLSYRLRQQARLGDYTPPDVALDIEEAQAAIRDLKVKLRAAGAAVEDRPEDTAQAPIASRLPPADRRNRDAMLQKVRAIWVKGLLEQSLADETRIALDLEEHPDAVRLPLNAQVQELRRPSRMLPRDTPIVDVFDDLGGELLILGAPGAGKTTLLLELARDLLDRAATDERYPIPVVFNLSSWAARRPPLAAWLIDDLNTVYDVPRKVARAWVDGDALLPLLDGLDEVKAEHCAACVEAINDFRKEHGAVNLVVCSRIADYEALDVRLKLQGAVLIQPLTAQQIDAYLDRVGGRLAGLRAALAGDAALCELAASPLMLAIMTLAYQGQSSSDLPTAGSAETQRQLLFDTYVERMFARRGEKTRYLREQTVRWLAWLARGMQRHGQSVFLVERLQPDWLSTRAARWQYALGDRLGVALSVGLVGALIFGLVGWLVMRPRGGLAGALGVGLIFGLVGALVGGFFGGESQSHGGAHQGIWRSSRSAILGGLVGGLSIQLVGLLVNVQGFVLIGGLGGALAGALAGGPGVRPRSIGVVETIRWSPSKAMRSALGGLVVGLVFGLVVGLVFGLVVGLRSEPGGAPVVGPRVALVSGLVFGLIFGLVGALVFGLAGGLTSGELAAKAIPNQGIRRSALGALVFGLVFGLGGALVSGLVFGLGGALVEAQGIGVGIGLVFGLVGALTYGGYACLSHIVLRLVFWHSGALPLNLIAFLDEATERIFLRKVGGGYIFLHRLLLEYFAALEPPTVEHQVMA